MHIPPPTAVLALAMLLPLTGTTAESPKEARTPGTSGTATLPGSNPASVHAEPAGPAVYYLNQFGKVNTPKDAQTAFEAASEAIQNGGGGLLIIPNDTVAGWVPKNQGQHELRIPPAPAPAKTWREGPGMMVFDPRGKQPTFHPAPITGLSIRRVLDLPEGESLPHWNYNPMVNFENVIARGSTSYHDWLQEDVEPGENARFYVATIRGLFPGMFITANAWSTVERLYVKSLGYDPDKRAWYLVAETTKPFKKGTILSNKNHVNILKMETSSHNENQTFDIHLLRKNYSQGDNYLIDARFRYMGDIHSTAGDENGVIYGAFIQAELNAFKSTVEKWAPETGELVFKGGANAATLGSGRPLLNMNPKKWVTAGHAYIVRPAQTETDPLNEPAHSLFEGKRYPSTSGPNHLGNIGIHVGGLIRLSKEAPVSTDCIGRYFAVDQDDESPKGTHARRWYLIQDVKTNPDGTKDIQIVRHWWGAKPASSPTLYNPANYSFDGHLRPLQYAIVPGVNVYEVSKALPGPGSKPVLMLSPSPFAGSAVDFAPGDPIEQAIGPDPFHPQPFRSWTWDEVPSSFPASYFDVRNMGQVQRHSVLAIGGGSGNLASDKETRWSHAPVFDRWIDFRATARNGIIFNADVEGAALLFMQPNERVQPIQWAYGSADAPKRASLSVSPNDGALRFEGGGAAIPGGLSQIKGLSGSATNARNLRGLGVPVKEGAKEVSVAFQEEEEDEKYVVFVENTWMTMHLVSERTPKGFKVRFSEAAPSNAAIHWLLTR